MTLQLWSFVYATGAAQGVLLAIALWRRQGKGDSYRVLATWVGLLSVHLLVLVLFLQTSDPNAWLLRSYGMTQFLPFVYAGFFFVYVRTLLDQRSLAPGDWIHAGPLMLAIAFNLDLIGLPVAELQALFVHGRLPADLSAWRFRVFDQALLVCSVAYVMAAIWRILRYRRRLRSQRSDADRRGLRWLLMLAGGQIAIWGVVAIQVSIGLPGFDQWFIYGTVSAWVWVLGYMSLTSPGPVLVPEPETPPAAGNERYSDVLARVDKAMEIDELYRRHSLTIAELSRKSGYPEYLVSEAINRVRNTNFFEYVNRWRIDAVKQAIAASPGGTKMIDIAYDAGFTSKSTFNQAFKRYAGMTPSAYRNTIAAATHTHPD